MSLNVFWESSKKIVAIGRNFAEHAKELGNAVPTKPFFFLKPTTSFVRPGGAVVIPPRADVHHEVELAVIIGSTAKRVKAAEAMNHVAGYAVALDMTARNFQMEAKEKGLPWSAAKGYDTFCPIGDFIEKEKIKDPHNVELWLKIDGQIKQKGSTNQMIFDIPQLIEHVSSIMTLERGDVILTGTPSGVGPVKAGQKLECGVTGITEATFHVEAHPESKL
ncbi:hypothetical protein PROFUN_15096 [Planoprotostelium fungivorum]|uniref:Fumarylacetoacetase-like C-terminal domain-containing protein n=1 Tax=Planoprotostelium fungivorum TaxID=1890364 RepID=A0A2P6MXT4_9EUKA|nr:hypothetical protein PROFUN_15096 [Planoprotostelium fungivorum]